MPNVIHHLFNDDEKARCQMRDRLASAAAELALKENIEYISIDAIAKTAGVSQSTFYKCFYSLECLFEYTTNKVVQSMVARVIRTIKPSQDIAIFVAPKVRVGIRLVVDDPKLTHRAITCAANLTFQDREDVNRNYTTVGLVTPRDCQTNV